MPLSSSRPFTLNWMKAKSAKEATLQWAKSRTIISITFVMSAVFIPVSFKRTSRVLPTVCSNFGHCYFDFRLTHWLWVLLLQLLKPHTDSKHRNANFKERFFIAFNTNFDRMNKKYVKSLGLDAQKMDRCCGSFYVFWNYRFSFPNYAFRIYS
jgi:HAE1 family hydrophobic/amphiphilic exporter-1